MMENSSTLKEILNIGQAPQPRTEFGISNLSQTQNRLQVPVQPWIRTPIQGINVADPEHYVPLNLFAPVHLRKRRPSPIEDEDYAPVIDEDKGEDEEGVKTVPTSPSRKRKGKGKDIEEQVEVTKKQRKGKEDVSTPPAKKSPRPKSSVKHSKDSFEPILVSPEYKDYWKSLLCRSIVRMRKIDLEEFKANTRIVDCIQKAGLMKTVTKVSPFAKCAVLELYCNLSSDFDQFGTDDYQKVFVRNKRYTISPSTINAYYGVPDFKDEEEWNPTDEEKDVLGSEVSCGKMTDWSKRRRIDSVDLDTDYSALKTISMNNWTPCKQSSKVSYDMALTLYRIKNNKVFNLGRLIFGQIASIGKTTSVSTKSIVFPNLIYDLLIEQGFHKYAHEPLEPVELLKTHHSWRVKNMVDPPVATIEATTSSQPHPNLENIISDLDLHITNLRDQARAILSEADALEVIYNSLKAMHAVSGAQNAPHSDVDVTGSVVPAKKAAANGDGDAATGGNA